MIFGLWWVFYWFRVFRVFAAPWCRAICRRDRGRGWRRKGVDVDQISPTNHARNTAKPAWVVAEIIRLKALMPSAGCRKLAHSFNRLHVDSGMSVGKSFVADCVRRKHYEIVQARRELKHRLPAKLARNKVWAIDLTGKGDGGEDGGGVGRGSSGGRVHTILCVLDHGSRAVLVLQRLTNKRALTLLGHLLIAIGEYGKPSAIRMDNEAVFRGGVFKVALKLLGIRRQFTQPGCPWQNGRIERFFGTLKASLDQITVFRAEALDGLLRDFRFYYNHTRPHQHLNGATPAEAWAGVDWLKRPAKNAEFVSLWDGMLTDYYLRR